MENKLPPQHKIVKQRVSSAGPNWLRELVFFAFFLLGCFGQSADGQTATDAKVPVDKRVFTSSKVYSLLQLYSLHGKAEAALDFDSSYGNYIHKILVTDDHLQFDLATVEFVAQLHNSHTFFWDTPLDKSNKEPLGFYALPLEGQWVVQTSFLRDLKQGDIISKINDTAIESFFLQQRKYISASSIAAQRRNFFLLPYLFPEQFTLKLESGGQVVVNRTSSSDLPQKTEGRWLKQGITAYIRIPSFFHPDFEATTLHYLQQFHRAKVLIIDVRNNPGGIPPGRLIRALMDRPYRGWLQVTTRAVGCAPNQLEATQEPIGDSQETRNLTQLAQNNKPIAPSQNAFRGRLILLVDGGCVSACEDFIEPSKDSGRAMLVGETTQGSAGVPLFYDFHNGMTLRIAYKRNYLPDGSEFEGVGIKPDVEVDTTIDDLKNGRDPVLEKALELAANP